MIWMIQSGYRKDNGCRRYNASNGKPLNGFCSNWTNLL